jgi:hypothetical protein
VKEDRHIVCHFDTSVYFIGLRISNTVHHILGNSGYHSVSVWKHLLLLTAHGMYNNIIHLDIYKTAFLFIFTLFPISITFLHSNYCYHTYNKLADYHSLLLMQWNTTSVSCCGEEVGTIRLACYFRHVIFYMYGPMGNIMDCERYYSHASLNDSVPLRNASLAVSSFHKHQTVYWQKP